MKHEQSFSTLDTDVREWLPTIRKQLSDIDTDSGLTPDDKKLLKQFYFTKCLPPSIQDVARKYFPNDFRVNEYVGRSEGRAHVGDRSRWESRSKGLAGSEGNSVIIQSDDENE